MPVISIDRAIRTVGPIDFVVIAAPTKTEENNYIIDYVKKKVKCKIIDMSCSLLTHNNHRYVR